MQQSSRTILIVDDSPEDRELYRRYLQQDPDYFYTILEASLGRQGLQLWQQQQPDLVLLNYRLPDLDGLEFLAQLPSPTPQTCLSAIVTIDRGNEKLALQMIKAGAQDYLITGQISPERLRLTIHRAIETVQLCTEFHQRRNVARFPRHTIATRQRRERERGVNLRQAELYEQSQTERAARQRVEAELRESEERLRISHEVSLYAFTTLDSLRDESGKIIDFVWTYVNPKAAEILKRPIEELLGKRLLEVLPGNKLNSELFERYVRVVETGEPHENELSYAADGINGWFRNMTVKLKDGVAIVFNDITERKQTEEALRENEQLLRFALAGAQAGSWNWDLATGKVTWSPENYVLHGFDPAIDSPSYETWSNSIHPEDRELVTAKVVEIIEQRLPEFRNEFRIIHPQRGLRWLLGLGQLTLDERGNPLRLSGINLDITDRKQSEAMLQRTAERDAFRVALADGLRSLDDPVEVQVTACRILGEYLGANRVTYFEVRGTDYFIERNYVNGAEPLQGGYPIDSFGSALLAAFRAGKAISAADVATDPNLSPAQQSVYAAIQIAAYIGIPLVKNGEFVAGLAIHTSTPRAWTPEEISLAEEVAERTWAAVERARAETALRISHDTFRHLVENSPFGVYAVDADFRLAQVSAGAQKVFVNVRPLLGRDFAEVLRILWSEPFASEAIAHFRHTLATGEPYHAPSTIERRYDTDEVESYDWKIERITLPDGRFGVVCHFYDLSERQQMLQREQAARAEAERANRIKDEFLAIVSHELRSPLNPILGWAKLLQTRQFDPAKTAEALATIERNAKLQTQLIDDLLDVAKILRGKLSMNVAPVDLAVEIEAAIDIVKATAEAKDIVLRSVLSPIGWVSGDAARLQQIIWNLLSNAIKFTPAKGQVEIRLEREGDRAKITVSDTGKGIDPDFLPYIFESFQQEDTSTTRQYGGLGLGLAIVRHLVETHGGTISAASQGKERGATFIVQLPLLDTRSDRPTSAPISSTELDLRGMRILVVDDELDTRELLTVLLTQYGAEVLTVRSATEVLTNLASFQPDLLISDIGMPDVNGYILMQQIRALPPERGGQIVAIALTAYAREEDYHQAIASGYQRHLTKPLDLYELVKAVVELRG